MTLNMTDALLVRGSSSSLLLETTLKVTKIMNVSLMTKILKINRHSTQHKILCLELVSYHYHKQPVCRFLVLRVE